MTDSKIKNSKFMDLFGDLASDNTGARTKAGAVIVKYLIHTQGGVLDAVPNALCPDLEYSLRRLVRGLSSSRQSARQGFAACLSEVLFVFDFVSYDQIMELIDETTKTTGSMKRAEERDYTFGKLFGYLTLIHANRVRSADEAVDITDRLLVLYDKKPWMHEIVTEALLSTLQSVHADAAATAEIISKLVDKAILFGPVEEMTASQLIMLIGLQNHFAMHPAHSHLFTEAFSYKHAVTSLKKIDQMAPALIASCAGYPKIHRVWDYLLSGVFPMDSSRQLVPERSPALTQSQGAALGRFTDFMDKHLISSSQEKRGVAMALAAVIATRTPINLLNKGLSQGMVRCLVATRMNKKHTLFVVAGQAIDTIVASAHSPEERLALASTFIEHGSPSFDAKTSTRAVAGLLAGADAAGVLGHVASICGIIGAALAAVVATPLCRPTSESQVSKKAAEAVEGLESSEGSVSVAIAGLSELAALMRNADLPGRAEVFEIALAVLIRLACFSVGGTDDITASKTAAASKTPKKGSKKAAVAAGASLSAHVSAAVKALEEPMLAAGSSGAELNLPASITDAAASRLVSCIADMGHLHLSQLDKPTDSNADGVSASGPTVLDMATGLLEAYVSNGGLFCFHGHGVGNTAVEDDDVTALTGAKTTVRPVVEIVRSGLSSYQLLGKHSSSHPKVVSAFKSLVGHSLFHVLITTDLSLDTVRTLIDEVVPVMALMKAPISKDDDDDEDSVQLTLFETCIDLLSIPDTQHPIKGIREAIKKVWAAIAQSFSIDYELVVSVAEFIAGEEGVEGSSAEHGHVEDDDAEEEENGSDDGSVDSQAEAIRAAMKAAATGEKATGKRKREESEEGSSDEDSNVLEPVTFADLPEDAVQSDSDSESDSEQGLQHTEEADDALVNMLQLKKQNRKRGLMEAKRVQLLNRTRAVDILEAIISRNATTGYLMVPLFTPLLRCLKRCTTSTVIRSMQEGRAFENRLKALFESKLNKDRFHLVSAEDTTEELMAEIDALTSEAIAYCGQLLNSTESLVRNVAAGAFVALLRAVVSSPSSCGVIATGAEEDKPARVMLVDTLHSLSEQLFTKRNSRVPVKVLHDITDRFPAYVCEHLLKDIVKACSEVKSSFLRGEACKLISAIVKKYKSLPSDCQKAVIAAVSDVCLSVSSALQAGSGESADIKAKRLKPILELTKDLLKLFLGEVKGGSKVTVEKKAVDALLPFMVSDSSFVASTKSAVVKRLTEQVGALLAELPSANIQTGGQESKKAVGSKATGIKNKRKMSDLEEEEVILPKSAKKTKKK